MQRPFVLKRWLVVAVLLLLATCIVAACRPVAVPVPGAAAAATPTAVATMAPSAATPDPANDWERITAAGTLVVGTSSIYPPFEYYNDTFQIDGFDPALTRALAEQMGLNVVFKDIAFDGLGSALAMGQIDAAISAITMTPERAAQFDLPIPTLPRLRPIWCAPTLTPNQSPLRTVCKGYASALNAAPSMKTGCVQSWSNRASCAARISSSTRRSTRPSTTSTSSASTWS